MFGGLAALLIAPLLDLVTLLTVAIDRAASSGFLRLATLFLAQSFDLATFNVLVARHGVRAEANPIVVDLFDAFGMSAVVVAKLCLVLLVGGLCLAAAARERRGVWSLVGGLPLALAITAGLVGGITNAAAFLG